MPSWSVLTSGWGERPARERSKAGRRRDLRLDSKEKGRLKEEGEERGAKREFHAFCWGKTKKERQEYEIAERQSQNRRWESRE